MSLFDQKQRRPKTLKKHVAFPGHADFLGLNHGNQQKIVSNPNVGPYPTMKVWNKRGKESRVIPLGQ